MTTPNKNFRIRITPHADDKLRDAPIGRLPSCEIRAAYQRQGKRKRPYVVRGLNNVMLHCNPCDDGCEIVDINSPQMTPCSSIAHARMGLQDVSFDERRLVPASVPCPHPAGSAERIEAMARRAMAGEQLYSEQDSLAIKQGPIPQDDVRVSIRELFRVKAVVRRSILSD